MLIVPELYKKIEPEYLHCGLNNTATKDVFQIKIQMTFSINLNLKNTTCVCKNIYLLRGGAV